MGKSMLTISKSVHISAND